MSVDLRLKQRLIWGEKVLLVPYREHHVEKYNQWMKDSELQYLTASEPLTLEEEYDMLKSWTNDENKCTFIILDRVIYEQTKSEVHAMIGDVNLFFDSNQHNDLKQAEIEVMIAELSHRGLGKGKEAILLMIRFAVEVIQVQNFVAKIKENNISSQKLFYKLGFREQSKSEIFQEITFSLLVDQQLIESITEQTAHFRYQLL